MSFILDALKKSESDRQRQSGPSLFEVKVAPPPRRLPIWAVAIAVLLGVNVVVVSWMLLRHPAAQQPPSAGNAPAAAPPPAMPAAAASAGQAVTTSQRPDAGAGRSPVTPPATGVAAAGPTENAAAAGPAAGVPAAARAASSTSTEPAAAEAVPPAAGSADQPPAADNPSDNAPAIQPGATGPGASADAGAALPLYQQIVTSDGLPELHLDLHVFADRPQDRFVMINMHRLGEGDSLPSGVRVDAIRPDGVVLTYRGTQFLLPRN